MTLEELKKRQSWTFDQKLDHAVATVENFFLGSMAAASSHSPEAKTPLCCWILFAALSTKIALQSSAIPGPNTRTL